MTHHYFGTHTLHATFYIEDEPNAIRSGMLCLYYLIVLQDFLSVMAGMRKMKNNQAKAQQTAALLRRTS